jgi:IPT/TIG domain
MISPGPLAFLSFGLCLPALIWGADPPPQFTPEGVAGGGAKARILVPGAGMSIYGRYLGSRPSDCAASGNGIYASNVCDTQVLIGDKPAELLFVSETQINFKVPLDALPSDAAELRVVYRGQSSMPLTMKVGPQKTTVSVDQPAYADMPIWLRVELPFQYGVIRYPYSFGLAGFGCNEVEVRRNGESLPLIPGSSALGSPGTFVGPLCASYGPSSHIVGRLPLHLLYNFRAPGTYEVRFTLRSEPFGAPSQTAFKVRSEWTTFEVLPSEPNRRAEWLNSLREHPPVDSGEWLTDTLPGLLGIPDESSLEILAGYLNHPDSSVRRYAFNGLSYWPEASVLRRLVALFDNTGASDTPEQNAERDFLAILPEILYRRFGDAAVPYLERALRTERGNRMARNIALQLMIANDPVGFQFAARVVEQKSHSGIEMIEILKRQFPELKNANSNEVAAFVERRAGQSVPDRPERK